MNTLNVNASNKFLPVKDAAVELKIKVGQIKHLIYQGLIDWKLNEKGNYVVNIKNVYETYNKGSSTTFKKQNKGIINNRVNFNYKDFLKIIFDCVPYKQIKIDKNCNFVISEYMKKDIFDNEKVIEHLKNKYKGKSVSQMIRIVVKNSLGFKDNKMPNTDYGFLLENIDGEEILVFCRYCPMNLNQVEFFVGLTYENFKLFLEGKLCKKDQTEYVVEEASNDEEISRSPMELHKVNGFWRNQPYGSRQNPRYERIWINDFERGGKKVKMAA